MEGLGKHVLIELFHCEELRIDSAKEVEKVMLSAAELCRTTVIQHFFHKFSPHGISGVVLIAESHLTIHTWPEHAYAAVDLFLCSNHDWRGVVEHLKRAFGAGRCSVFEFTRGIIPEDVCQREIG